MNINKVKRDVLENFVLWYNSGEDDREAMMKSVDDYIDNDHINLIGSFFLSQSNVELILEGVYLHDDKEEMDVQYVFCINGDNPQRPTIYSQSGVDCQIRTFILTEDQDVIAKEHREEILEYRLARFTDEDEVCLGDIFMHMKFIKEIL